VTRDRGEQQPARKRGGQCTQNDLRAARDPMREQVVAGGEPCGMRDAARRFGSQARSHGRMQGDDLAFFHHLSRRRIDIRPQPHGVEELACGAGAEATLDRVGHPDDRIRADACGARRSP
jgi:hypothetical protein